MGELTRLLFEDPELAGGLQAERLSAAERDCVARTIELPNGTWAPAAEADTRHGIGLLILDGMIVRRVSLVGRFGAELLGDGDLMRPSQREDAGATLPRTDRWRVLRRSRMAVLDADFTARAGRYPEVISALFARALKRSRHTAVNMAIIHHPRVDVRLHMLLWELADRWGTVHPDGVHVALHLTHTILGDLVGARRATVSRALGELAERGIARWDGDHWLLLGDPPAELSMLGSVKFERRHTRGATHAGTAAAGKGSDTR
jgi:CRP/FNR family transcriptional regulator, cyclic AMP receptor protein